LLNIIFILDCLFNCRNSWLHCPRSFLTARL
jgi:hypothetical protein